MTKSILFGSAAVLFAACAMASSSSAGESTSTHHDNSLDSAFAGWSFELAPQERGRRGRGRRGRGRGGPRVNVDTLFTENCAKCHAPNDRCPG